MQITNYTQAETYLAGGRNKNDRPLPGNGTRLTRDTDTGDISVTYHGTPVVTYHPDGTLTVTHGGWKTKTTAERIETYSPLRVDGVLETTWSWHREYVRRGPDTWNLRTPDGRAAIMEGGTATLKP